MSFTTTPISEIHLILGGDPISFDDMEIPEDAVIINSAPPWNKGYTGYNLPNHSKESRQKRSLMMKQPNALSEEFIKTRNNRKGKPHPHTQKMNSIKHHCPVHDKWMNIGNLMRYHRECIK